MTPCLADLQQLPAIPDPFQKQWLRFRTPVNNLHLTGADAMMLGILPTMISGVFVYAVSSGLPFHLLRVLKTAIRYRRDPVNRD